MLTLIRFLTAEFGGSNTTIRRSGLLRMGAGAAIRASVGLIASILFVFIDSHEATRVIIAISLPFGIAGISAVAVGVVPTVTGRLWSDNPQWIRFLALIVTIPITFFLAAVAIGVVVNSF